MRLIVDRIEVTATSTIAGDSGFSTGMTEHPAWSSVGAASESDRWMWWVADGSGGGRAVRSVALVLRVVDVVGPLRMLRHGYQSWSPCDVATFGVDVDPSSLEGSIELFRGTFLADQRMVADRHELRSEWFTLLVDDRHEPVFVGFDGGDRHDGTMRLRDVDGVTELWCEALLGDCELPAGSRLDLHDLLVAHGVDDGEILAEWASLVGDRADARTDASYQVGWCSWYHYFHGVTERDVLANLERADDWPFDVFQIDDGFQSAIGDWMTTNEDFPSDLPSLAAAIAGRGRRPGLWLAPFLAAPDSRVATDHPDWLARDAAGEPLAGTFNPPWGGGRRGLMYALDTTRPEVVAHLETLASDLVAMGFTYLKLDFTFAPSLDGRWSDRTRTPAQRVRAGFDAIRRGAGDDAFLLGCGVPLANAVGVIDGARIGADVAPSWDLEDPADVLVGFAGARPAVRNAWIHTALRAFQHRRLWLNDPDCLMLRSSHTALSAEAARTWARAVGVSGGMALVCEDLALLDRSARALLDETLELGRRSDAAAREGRVAASPGLVEGSVPTVLTSDAGTIVVDPSSGASSFTGAR